MSSYDVKNFVTVGLDPASLGCEAFFDGTYSHSSPECSLSQGESVGVFTDVKSLLEGSRLCAGCRFVIEDSKAELHALTLILDVAAPLVSAAEQLEASATSDQALAAAFVWVEKALKFSERAIHCYLDSDNLAPLTSKVTAALTLPLSLSDLQLRALLAVLPVWSVGVDFSSKFNLARALLAQTRPVMVVLDSDAFADWDSQAEGTSSFTDVAQRWKAWVKTYSSRSLFNEIVVDTSVFGDEYDDEAYTDVELLTEFVRAVLHQRRRRRAAFMADELFVALHYRRCYTESLISTDDESVLEVLDRLLRDRRTYEYRDVEQLLSMARKL